MNKKLSCIFIIFILAFNLASSSQPIKVKAETSNNQTNLTLQLFNNTYYQYTNNTSKIITITNTSLATNNNRYGILKYNSSFQPILTNNNAYGDINVLPGETVKLNCFSGSVFLNLEEEVKNKFILVNEQLFRHVVLEFGTSYEFINTSNLNSVTICNDSYSKNNYNFVYYDDDGNVLDTGKNSYGSYSVQPNYKFKISSNNGKLNFFIPNDCKSNFSLAYGPVLTEYPLLKDTTIVILPTNSSFLNKNIKLITNSTLSNNKRFDFVYYKENSVVNYGHNNYGDLFMEFNSKLKLTALSDNISFYLPSEFANFYSMDNEALDTIDITSTETFYLNNKSTKDIKIITNTNADNNLSFNKIEKNLSTNNLNLLRNDFGTITVKPNSEVKLTASNNPIQLFIPTEFKSFSTKISEPLLFSKVVESNKRYGFKNTTNSEFTIFNNCEDDNNLRFKYYKYDANSQIVNSSESYTDSIILYPGERLEVTPIDSNITFFTSSDFIPTYEIGDIDENGIIDILDLSEIANSYNAIKDHSKKDLNNDQIIDLFDLSIIYKKIQF